MAETLWGSISENDGYYPQKRWINKEVGLVYNNATCTHNTRDCSQLIAKVKIK